MNKLFIAFIAGAFVFHVSTAYAADERIHFGLAQPDETFISLKKGADQITALTRFTFAARRLALQTCKNLGDGFKAEILSFDFSCYTFTPFLNTPRRRTIELEGNVIYDCVRSRR